MIQNERELIVHNMNKFPLTIFDCEPSNVLKSIIEIFNWNETVKI